MRTVLPHGVKLVLVMLLALLTGCEDRAAKDIRRTYKAVYDAITVQNGDNAVALLAPKTHEYYDRIVKIGRDGTKKQLMALRPTELLEVLTMRQMATREELAPLDGKGYIAYAVGHGWWNYWSDDEDEIPPLGKITVKGNTATANIRDSMGKQTHHKYDFVLIDGLWRLDWNRADDLSDQQIIKAATEERMNTEQFLCEFVGMKSQSELKADIWDWNP